MNWVLKFTVGFGASISVCSALTAANSELPVYELRRVRDKLETDGRFEEPAWFAALPIGDFSCPWFKSCLREQSIAKLVWDDEYFYLASICQDAHIAANNKMHDEPLAGDDCFELMFSPNR